MDIKELQNHFENDLYLFNHGQVEIIMPSAVIIDIIDPLNACKKLEKIIRVAYKSEDKITDNSYLKMLDLILTNKHLSTLEHVNYTFHMITNRGVTHELVRHRIASFTQESTRYVNYNKKPAQIIYPAWLYNKPTGHKVFWYDSVCRAMMDYKRLIDLDFKPQEARGVLPNDVKTEIYTTMNIRELLHFFSLRNTLQAHPDMQIVTNILHQQMKESLPMIFNRE